jgi:hypothetical protein
MFVFALASVGSWIGFGYCLGTNNLAGKIAFPIIAFVVSIVGEAAKLIEPVKLQRYDWGDDE